MSPASYTSDLGFAGALLTLGHKIEEELKKGEDGRLEFGFYVTQSVMRRLYTQYMAKDLSVDANKNADSIKHVKKMLVLHKESRAASNA